MIRKICRYFGHLDKSFVSRPSDGLQGFAFNEFDFVHNVEVGKRTTRRIHKRSVGTQTDTPTTVLEPVQLSPSVFSKEFKMLR